MGGLDEIDHAPLYVVVHGALFIQHEAERVTGKTRKAIYTRMYMYMHARTRTLRILFTQTHTLSLSLSASLSLSLLLSLSISLSPSLLSLSLSISLYLSLSLTHTHTPNHPSLPRPPPFATNLRGQPIAVKSPRVYVVARHLRPGDRFEE